MKQKYRGHLLLESCISLSLISVVALVFLSSATVLVKQQRRREAMLELYRLSYETIRCNNGNKESYDAEKEVNGDTMSVNIEVNDAHFTKLTGVNSKGDIEIELEDWN